MRSAPWNCGSDAPVHGLCSCRSLPHPVPWRTFLRRETLTVLSVCSVVTKGVVCCQFVISKVVSWQLVVASEH